MMEKFPHANFYKCPSPTDCIEKLKKDQCSRYADDELLLRYRTLSDSALQLNSEKYFTQYLAWPTSYTINKDVSILLKKWIYAAIVDNTLDKLYATYFEHQLCPIGTAGTNCTDPCHPKYGAADFNGRCVCDSTKWTGSDCSIEVMHDKNQIPLYFKQLIYSLYCILLVMLFSCFIWLKFNKKTPQVIAYQPFFLRLILLGCLVSSSATIPLGIEKEKEISTFLCMLVPWLYSVGFSIVFGTLLAKVHRVHTLFDNAARMIRTTVTLKETVLKIVYILIIDITILTIWTIMDPLQWVWQVTIEDKYGQPLSSYEGCYCRHPLIWMGTLGLLHVSLLVMAIYMSYRARHISTRFSEAKYLKTAIFLNTVVYIISVPMIVITREPEATFFVSCMIIICDSTVVCGSIFGGLIYSVINNENPDANVNDELRSYVRRSRRTSIALSVTEVSNQSPNE